MTDKETIKEAGYSKMKRINKDLVYLWNPVTELAELWGKSPHYAEYSIVINKICYEFIRTNDDIRFCSEHQKWEEK